MQNAEQIQLGGGLQSERTPESKYMFGGGEVQMRDAEKNRKRIYIWRAVEKHVHSADTNTCLRGGWKTSAKRKNKYL